LVGEDQPRSTVDQFADRIQVAGMNRGLRDHREQNASEVPHRQIREDFDGPPGGPITEYALRDSLV